MSNFGARINFACGCEMCYYLGYLCLKGRMTLILFFMDLFSRLFKIKEEERSANYEINKKLRLPTTGDGYIERQNQMAGFRYGAQRDFLSKMLLKGKSLDASVNSCELIAVYNVMRYFGIPRKFFDIVNEFEKDGCSFYGYFGSSIKAVAKYLADYGLTVRRLRIREILPGESRTGGRVAYIVCGENIAWDIRSMIHTISITMEGNILRAHNTFGDSGLYPNLYEAVVGFSGGKGRVLCVYEVTLQVSDGGLVQNEQKGN